jgi:hypothetical protein
MKLTVLCAVLLFATAGFAQQPDPAYPVTIHVISSRLVTQPAGSKTSETDEWLHVVINGKKYELEGSPLRVTLTRDGVIVPGDYNAALIDNHAKGTYLIQQEYAMKFPDGSSHKFTVVGESE